MTTKKPNVLPATAMSVQAPLEGWCDATGTTTDEYVDLTKYKGQYICLEAEGANFYVAFKSATGGTIVTGGTAVGTALVPRTIYKDTPNPNMVVPPGAPWMVYRTVSATGLLRVTPA